MFEIVTFNGQELELKSINRQKYFSAPQLGRALGYARADKVNSIYQTHADEFTPDMTCTTESVVQGQVRKVRVFSLRGCHLLAMFSRTPIAKQFRVWVLDLIEKYNQPQLPAPLDAKAVGGIVKNCCAVAVREELERAATDMIYAEKFKQLARSVLYDHMGEVMLNEEMLPKWRAMFQRWMKDVIYSEDYFGALKKLMIPWVRDAFKGGDTAVWNDFIAMGLETRVNALLEAKKKELAKEINKLLM